MRRTIGQVVLAIAASAWLAASSAAEGDGGDAARIRGSVRDEEGSPVAGAVVRALSFDGDGPSGFGRWGRADAPGDASEAATDENGVFSVELNGGGPWAVRVEAAGLAPFTAWRIPKGASLNVTLRAGEAVRGRIVDRETGAGVDGARVRYRDRAAIVFGDAADRTLTSGEGGVFVAPDLPPGAATVEAWSPSHAKGRVDVVVEPATERSLGGARAEIVLGPGGSIGGTVAGTDGGPEEGVRVTLLPGEFDPSRMAGWRPERVESDVGGRFRFEGIPVGEGFRLRAEAEGFPPAEAGPFSIAKGTDRGDLSVRLGKGATLALRLADPGGAAVRDASFELYRLGAREGFGLLRRDRVDVPADLVRIDDEGRILVSPLPEGRFRLRIVPQGWRSVERNEIRLREGETIDLGVVPVKEGSSVAGRVTDTAGEPIAGARVTASSGGRRRALSRTAIAGPEGRYRIEGLDDEALRSVAVTAKGFASATREDVVLGDSAVDFALEATGSVAGRVAFAEGGTPPSFRITLHRESDLEDDSRRFPKREEVTDPSGLFRIDDVDPGRYTVEAAAKGRVPSLREGIVIPSGGLAEAGTLELDPGRTLRGRVVASADGRPVVGARIGLERRATRGSAFALAFGDADSTGAVTDTEGGFVLEGLEAGSLRLAIVHPDFAPTSSDVRVPSDSDPEGIVVELSRGGVLTGTVRDSDRRPVAGAQIMVGAFGGGSAMAPKTALTGADGIYRVESLAPGSYQVLRARPDDASPFGVGVGMKSATIRDGETTVVDFDDSGGPRLSGRLLRGGNPVAGATAMFVSGDDGVVPEGLKTATTDDEGRFEVLLDRPGPYRVLVQSRGFGRGGSSSGARIVVPDEPEVVMDVVLPAGGIVGTVVDETGDPVPGASIAAIRDGATATDFARRTVTETDASGAFSLDGVTPGTWRLQASALGFRVASEYPVIVPEEGEPPPIAFVLRRGVALRGRVLDPLGAPIAGAIVVVAPSAAPEATAPPANTDVNGRFSIVAPGDGPVDITALSGVAAPARVEGVPVPVDEEGPEIVLTAPAAARLRVTVTDSEGRPAAGAVVEVRPARPFAGSDFVAYFSAPPPTGSDGVSVADRLAPGPYRVAVASPARTDPVAVEIGPGEEASIALRLP